jgi:predicted Zn-dependent protease
MSAWRTGCLVLWGVVACHTAAPPTPLTVERPTDPAVLQMFDLSVAPPRPRLRLVAGQSEPVDTNDARAYYDAAMVVPLSAPVDIAALYWASRIDPSWAPPVYQRWAMLQNAAQQIEQVQPAALPDSTLVRIDALLMVAYGDDPFFDDHLYENNIAKAESLAVTRAIAAAECAAPQYPSRPIVHVLPGWIGAPADCTNREANWSLYQELVYCADPAALSCPWPPGPVYDPSTHWYVAYGHADYVNATRLLGAAVKSHPDSIDLYYHLAKAQFLSSQYDAAVVTLQNAVARIQRKPSAAGNGGIFTPALFQYAIGVLRQTQGRDTDAVAAYTRSVAIDPRWYMSHVHLAALALAANDTRTTIAHAQLAAQIRPEDPVVQLVLGDALLSAGQAADAATHFDAAIESDSSYAAPYMYLAEARLAQDDTARTVAALAGFLAHAGRNDAKRSAAASQLATLTTGRPSAGP